MKKPTEEDFKNIVTHFKNIVPSACHGILAELHPNLLEYIFESLKTDNEWSYNYFVTGDIWYWYHLNRANQVYRHLPIDVQIQVNIPALLKYPDSKLSFIKI